MKIKTLLLLLAVCILPGSLCAGVVFSPDTLGTGKLYRDSTYRRVIKEGTANLDCYFSYPQGGWQIQRGYGGNARELERLDKFMRSSFADTLIYVRRITLTGYCSIEGSYAANEKLAHDRANGFRNYLDTEYGLARRFPVEVRYVGEDWDRLRQLVEASTLPGRAEVLAVIDNTDIFKGREKKLMDLQGGVPYNLMMAELFPLLRRVEIRVEYDLHRIIEERYRRKLTDAEFQEILARERASASRRASSGGIPAAGSGKTAACRTDTFGRRTRCAGTRKRNRLRQEEAERLKEQRFREQWLAERAAGRQARREARKQRNRLLPLLSVKTNLYTWAGMTPDFYYTAFTPNLSAEFFLHAGGRR